jgi:competence protein ComEC
MAFLLRAFRVDATWEGPAAPGDASWRRFAQTLDGAGVPRVALVRGARYDWDGARLLVLGPGPPAAPAPRVRNDDSLVVEVIYGSVRLLLTGDVTADAESPLAIQAVDVVKVAHHGSRTSSSLRLTSVARPRLAVVSAGRRNPFGHPHAEVVERFERGGALVLRTDRDGSVHVATDGARVWVRTSGEGHERRIR